MFHTGKCELIVLKSKSMCSLIQHEKKILLLRNLGFFNRKIAESFVRNGFVLTEICRNVFVVVCFHRKHVDLRRTKPFDKTGIAI